jgi:hypothetical protein
LRKIDKIIILSLLFAFLISACKDDVIVVPPSNQNVVIKDSAMFDWEYILFNHGYIYDLFAADTDKAFISASSGAWYYNGKTFTLIDYNTPDFNLTVIRGTGPTNVYFGGGGAGQYITHARLKRWNGSSMQEIQMPDDSSKDLICIYIRNENDIWLATYINKIYHFNGLNITDTTYIPFEFLNSIRIFETSPGELYMYGWRGAGQNATAYFVLKLSNDNWNVVLSDTTNSNTELQERNNLCGNTIIRAGKTHIHNYVPNYWDEIPGEIDFEPRIFAGSSKDNFLCNAGWNMTYYYMYVHKDVVWYRESNYLPPSPQLLVPIYRLSYIKGYYFGLYYEYYDNYLITARPRIKVASGMFPCLQQAGRRVRSST